MYQHIMDYWAETMQDDFYELAADGWAAGNEVKRIEKKIKKGDKEIIKQVAGIEGLEGRLIPPALMIQEYFAREQQSINDLEAAAENMNAQMEELREEHGGEDGLLNNAIDNGKISKGNLGKAIKEAKEAVQEWKKEQKMSMAAEPAVVYGEVDTEENSPEAELDMLEQYKVLMEQEAEIQTQIKSDVNKLEILVIKQYPLLSIEEIKTMVVDKKWMYSLEHKIKAEMDNISHRLTQRIKELAERYENPLPQLNEEANKLTTKVEQHLKQMNFTW